jgi:hypothetical protein
VECNADKTLVSALGVPRSEIKHAHSKGNVCKRLESSRNSKGLVDEDPFSTQPRYIEKLKLLSYEGEIKVLYDGRAQNCLIMLCLRLEEWILKVVKEVKVDIGDYNLPDDADRLHKTINIKLKNFESLMEDMKEKSRMLKTLEKVISQ